MPLIYALVARGRIVLAEYTESLGNFPAVTRILLEKIDLSVSRQTYAYDEYYFHYIVSKDVLFLVMADKEIGLRIPYSFLEDIEGRFSPYVDIAQKAVALSLNAVFCPIIRQQMAHWNSPNADSYNKAKIQINDIQNVMIDNIDKILSRGEKIDLLVTKAEALSNESFSFRRRTESYNRLINNGSYYTKTLLIILSVCLLFFLLWELLGTADKARNNDDPILGNYLRNRIKNELNNFDNAKNIDIHQLSADIFNASNYKNMPNLNESIQPLTINKGTNDSVIKL